MVVDCNDADLIKVIEQELLLKFHTTSIEGGHI